MQRSVTEIPTWGWLVFGAIVTVMLALDLWAYGGKHGISRRTALAWSIAWIGAGLSFGGIVWATAGAGLVPEYYAAYAIEKSLSLDNIFLFYIIFGNLEIPREYQHKVLVLGILGAVVFRGVFIFLGVAAIERWEWVSYLFGAILLYAAWHAFREDPATQGKSELVEWLSRRLPVTEDVAGGKFVAKKDGRRVATPLLIALVAIELTDVMFAIDSVPAALSVTRNRFIVYSSNVFAILGLRALYLLLASTIVQMRYLHYGLSAVLAFAAFKILTDSWFSIPPLVSIGIVVALIGAAVWASLRLAGGRGSGAR